MRGANRKIELQKAARAMASEPPPPESLIPYDEIVQDALRDAVRRVMQDVALTGMPGAHHFYIGFNTRHPGVVLPPDLLQRYPSEMTIVLQNRYWDLKVHEDRFEVGLSFNQTPARLCIPFEALISFVDPAVSFGLQFQPVAADAIEQPAPITDAAPEPEAAPVEGNVVSLDRFRKKT